MRGIGLVFACLFGAGLFVTASIMGWYPRAIIKNSAANGGRAHIVWETEVRRMGDSALSYYAAALENASSSTRITKPMQTEAREKSMEVIIENIIIHDAITLNGLIAATDDRANQKIKEYEAQPNFSVAVSVVYGLTDSGFLDMVVRPAAERELLKEKNGWNDEDLALWLERERKEARIVRFFR
jgi:hypothetical protein